MSGLNASSLPSVEDAQRHFLFANAQLQKEWRRMVDQLLAPLGLTQALWMPLMHLHHAAVPMRQKDLAASLSLDDSSVVRLVDGLITQGWVKTVADSDRRVKRIQLTSTGEAQAQQVHQLLAQARAQVLDSVPAEALQAAFATVQRLRQALQTLAAEQNSLPQEGNG